MEDEYTCVSNRVLLLYIAARVLNNSYLRGRIPYIVSRNGACVMLIRPVERCSHKYRVFHSLQPYGQICIFDVEFAKFSQPPRFPAREGIDLIIFYIFVFFYYVKRVHAKKIEQKQNYRGE